MACKAQGGGLGEWCCEWKCCLASLLDGGEGAGCKRGLWV